MYIKIAFVVLLIIYHFACQKIMNDLIKNKAVWTSFRLRIWNEAATLFLVVIIFLVEMKSTMNWMYGVIGFFGIGASLALAIKLYKTIRENREKKVNN
jgi:putative membrane protein